MRHDATIKYLRVAEAIDAMEIYVVVGEQRKPNFGFRLWDGLALLTPEEATGFCKELNDVTFAIRQKWKRQFEDKAAGCFRHTRGVDP